MVAQLPTVLHLVTVVFAERAELASAVASERAELTSAVAFVSVAAPASASSASASASSVVKCCLEMAQLGRPKQPLVLLGVALPG